MIKDKTSSCLESLEPRQLLAGYADLDEQPELNALIKNVDEKLGTVLEWKEYFEVCASTATFMHFAAANHFDPYLVKFNVALCGLEAFMVAAASHPIAKSLAKATAIIPLGAAYGLSR